MIVQCYKMISRTKEEEHCGSNVRKGAETKEGESKKKATFEIIGVPLHYSTEVGNTSTCILSRKAYHIDVREQGCALLEKWTVV